MTPMATNSGEPLHILLIEDNEAHAELIIHGLQDNEMAVLVHHVMDGERALDYLLRQGTFLEPETAPRPDLVLLDLRIPRVDGLDVIRTIKTTPALLRIPVVVLTSSDAGPDIAGSYDYHANSYLVKPLDFRRFTQLLKDIVNYWLGWNARPPTE